MTFNFAPYAIDGARTTAGLARLAAYASGGGQSGVVQPEDLRVSAKAVPGQGVVISSGGAVVLNNYLSDVDESYVVSNPSPHTVLAADMPSAQPGTSYYLVCVVIGDPEFDQTGHPYMPSGPLDPEVAATFEYVRVVIIPCSSGTTKFEQLGNFYPAYALARLEVPANTTTITNAMITDLRQLAKPRTESRLILAQPVPAGPPYDLTLIDTWQKVNGWAPTVSIPSWATHMLIRGDIANITHIDPYVAGAVRTKVNDTGGAETIYEAPDTAGNGERLNIVSIWDGDVSSIAGSSVPVTIEVKKFGGAFLGAGYLTAYSDTAMILDIRFSEKPV